VSLGKRFMMDEILDRTESGEGIAEPDGNDLCAKWFRVKSRIGRHAFAIYHSSNSSTHPDIVYCAILRVLCFIIASNIVSASKLRRFITPHTQPWHQDRSSKWTTSTASSNSSKACQEKTTIRYDSLTGTTTTQHMVMTLNSLHKINTRQPR
jgi:hypothetical protein